MADDVTQKGPLRGGRQRANNIEVLRIEAGLKEREYVESYLAVMAVSRLMPAVGIAVGGIGAGLAGYALYRWLRKAWNWKDDLMDDLGKLGERIMGPRLKTTDPETGEQILWNPLQAKKSESGKSWQEEAEEQYGWGVGAAKR